MPRGSPKPLERTFFLVTVQVEHHRRRQSLVDRARQCLSVASKPSFSCLVRARDPFHLFPLSSLLFHPPSSSFRRRTFMVTGEKVFRSLLMLVWLVKKLREGSLMFVRVVVWGKEHVLQGFVEFPFPPPSFSSPPALRWALRGKTRSVGFLGARACCWCVFWRDLMRGGVFPSACRHRARSGERLSTVLDELDPEAVLVGAQGCGVSAVALCVVCDELKYQRAPFPARLRWCPSGAARVRLRLASDDVTSPGAPCVGVWLDLVRVSLRLRAWVGGVHGIAWTEGHDIP